tara:strand:- start:2123 stop:2413 length:291 start_codon:yes stop_codon:yes gene_type:complete
MTRYKLIDGKRVQFTAKEEKERDAEEKTWNDAQPALLLAQLRRERNSLLAETDYMGNSDVTMSAKWKTYRQELRDITKTFKSMSDKDFKFPTKPTE